MLSQYTAFVAVSDDVRVEPNEQNISVEVPLEMAEGVSYRAMPAKAAYAPVSRSMKPRRLMARAYSIDDDDLESAELSLRCFAPESISYEQQRSSSLSSAIEITETTGLDKVGLEGLKRHLATLAIPPVFKGELVFELQVKNGRVKQIVVDEKASTLNDKAVIKLIRQHLQTWKVPSSAGEHIVIKLQLNS